MTRSPDTSTGAYHELLDSGEDVTLRRELAAHIGAEARTLDELDEDLDMRWSTMSARVSELVRMGCVEREGKRQTESGNDAYVHYLTDLGKRYARGEVDPELPPTQSKLQAEVVRVARRYLNGEVDRDILSLAVDRHDRIKARQDPDWEPDYD